MMKLSRRRWRRFVRRQKSPVAARWLRWTQTCRDMTGPGSDITDFPWSGSFERNDGTSSYWCKICDSNGPGTLVDHLSLRHPEITGSIPSVCAPVSPRYEIEINPGPRGLPSTADIMDRLTEARQIGLR